MLYGADFISEELIYENTYYLDWMTLVIIWLRIAGTLSAWSLMLRLAELTQENKQTYERRADPHSAFILC